MMQWTTLFRKEVLENWRNYKWIWVPLVIILLSIMDPITTYYMPQILDAAGGMPEGAVFEMPTPSPSEAIMMSLGQINSLGILVIALISMGTIAGERKSGVTELILVKPIAYRNYILAKWFALIVLIWLSLSAGLLMSWYYINILFGDFAFTTLLEVIFFYGLWLTLVGTISIFYNALFKSPGAVAALSLVTIIMLSVITSTFSHILTWSPSQLPSHIQDTMISGSVSTDLLGTALVTIVITIIMLISSIYIFKTKELAE